MKIEITHYTELCYEGEVKRTGVIVFDDGEIYDFKTKGITSLSLRGCGLDKPCLVEALTNFNDFEIVGNPDITVNGEELSD